jgi:adenylate cyclase
MTSGTQRRLAAIVAADVVGYSRLMGADETATLAALRGHRSELIDPLVAEYGGRIVKTMGDGLLLEFPSIVDAARCSVELQKGMIDRNATVPDDAALRFRIGVHLGDIIIEGADIFGDGVNIAARIEAMAEPGGVAISDDAHRHVQGRLDVAWRDGGTHHAKNIARPISIWRWAPGDGRPGRGPATRTEALAPPGGPSIAVLPFDNMSGDRDHEYFSDGITEDIITEMSRIPGLLVISRNSTFTYKGKPVRPRDVDPADRQRVAGPRRQAEPGEDDQLRRDRDAIGPGQARFLKRQLSLPVSTMSQWWVSRSSSAVVILPKTPGHSPKAKFVVTITEVRS